MLNRYLLYYRYLKHLQPEYILIFNLKRLFSNKWAETANLVPVKAVDIIVKGVQRCLEFSRNERLASCTSYLMEQTIGCCYL